MALAILGLASLAVVAMVAWPLIAGAEPVAVEDPRADDRRQVEEELARVLAGIREIEADRRAGHLSEEDFAGLARDERARAVALMRRRDELAGPGP